VLFGAAGEPRFEMAAAVFSWQAPLPAGRAPHAGLGACAQDATISLYRCGPMVDLCTGPHLPNTGYLKAAAVHSMSRAFWRADVKREPLQVRSALPRSQGS
jgi:hypothetical protein